MFNWLSHSTQILSKVITKLETGERIGQLLTVIAAAVIAYIFIGLLKEPAMAYLSGAGTGMGVVQFLVYLAVVFAAVGTAFYFFSRWISDAQTQDDEEVLAEAHRISGQYDDPADLIKHIK